MELDFVELWKNRSRGLFFIPLDVCFVGREHFYYHYRLFCTRNKVLDAYVRDAAFFERTVSSYKSAHSRDWWLYEYTYYFDYEQVLSDCVRYAGIKYSLTN